VVSLPRTFAVFDQLQVPHCPNHQFPPAAFFSHPVFGYNHLNSFPPLPRCSQCAERRLGHPSPTWFFISRLRRAFFSWSNIFFLSSALFSFPFPLISASFCVLLCRETLFPATALVCTQVPVRFFLFGSSRKPCDLVHPFPPFKGSFRLHFFSPRVCPDEVDCFFLERFFDSLVSPPFVQKLFLLP